MKPTLILTPRYTEDTLALWKAAHELGWDVARLNGWKLTVEARTAAEPVLYIETVFAGMFARQLGLELAEPPEGFLPNLPERFRKRTVTLTTAAVAREAGTAFIKPPNDKSFEARVYEDGELPEQVADDARVLVSEIVEWTREFRVFTQDKRVRTASAYEYDGRLLTSSNYACPDEDLQAAIDFAQTVLDEANVPDPVVLDVGYVRDRGWAVIEANAPWGSGIYGCDPKIVLEVIRASESRA